MSAKVFTLFPKAPDPFAEARAAFDALDANIEAFERKIDDLEGLNGRVLMRSALNDAVATLSGARLRLSLIGANLPEGTPEHDCADEGVRSISAAINRIAEMERQARAIEDRLDPTPRGAA